MDCPDITLVIPFYKTGKYIRQCLDSVAAQSFGGRYEVILVDDRGGDDTLDIAREYAARDKRLKIVQHEHNKRLGAARNTGLRAAQGEYVAFLDSDDWLAPNALEAAHSAITAQRVESVWFDFMMAYEDTGKNLHDRMPFRGLVDVSEDVLRRTPCSGCNKLYRRRFLLDNGLEFDEGILYEDLGFFFRLCVLLKKAYVLDDALYFYRQRAGSIMNASEAGRGSCADMIASCEKCYTFLRERNLLAEHGDALLRLYAGHFGQFLFSRFYKREMIAGVKSLLERIDFAGRFDADKHPVLAAVAAYSGGKDNRPLYKLLSCLNKCNPNRTLRERWRAWLRVNLLAR